MRSEAETKRLKIALLVSGLFLCAAVLPVWPSFMDVWLQWIVCGAIVYVIAILTGDPAFKIHLVPLAVLATLFNPLIPVHLSRSLWVLTDLAVAAYFLTLAKKL
jgi:hypothetical protein